MSSETSIDEAPLDLLLRNRQAFLSFLERRVGDRALAEDILQDAFIKVIARPEQVPTDDGAMAWFYRSIRNAAIDRFRRSATASRALEAFARELEDVRDRKRLSPRFVLAYPKWPGL